MSSFSILNSHNDIQIQNDCCQPFVARHLFAEHLRLQTLEISPETAWTTGELNGLLFLFPQNGIGKLVTGTRSQRIMPGEIIAISSKCTGTIQAQGNTPMTAFGFTVRFEHMIPVLIGDDFDAMQKLFRTVNPFKWFCATQPVVQEAHKLLSQSISLSPLNHRVQLLQVTVTLLAKEYEGAQSGYVKQKPMERNLLRVLEQLSFDELLNLSVDDLAARCNCSSRHLNHLFHQYFRSSVAALKMEIRLLKAVSLLHSSSSKIIDVAQDCGFNHLGLFQTCFRRRFGVSPSRLREMMLNENKPKTQSISNEKSCQKFGTDICPLKIANAGGCGMIVNILADQNAAIEHAIIQSK